MRRALLLLWLLVGGPARAADLFDSIDLLAVELRSGDVARRRDAVDKLDAYEAGAARPYLVDALSDADLEVRTRAVLSLGRHRIVDAEARLIALGGDPEPRLRAAAAEALGQLGDGSPAVLKALERALGDSEHEVRVLAVGALGRLAARPLAVAVAARLDDENTAVREQAALVLARLGDARAVIPLIGRLGDSSREVRRAALDALGQLGDERAAPAMIRLLRPEQPEEVRAQAVQALGRLRSRAALVPLCDLLERGSEGLRGRAAFALGQIATRRAPGAEAEAADGAPDVAITALLSALGRDEARAAAREALARVGAPAVAPLIARLRNASGDELAAIVELLGELHDVRAAPPLVEELQRGRVAREKLVDALGALLRATAPDAQKPSYDLVALLGDGDPSVRRHVMTQLRGFADGRAVAALADAVVDTDREVRLGAVAELGRLRAARAVPQLLQQLAKGDEETACAAAEALGEIADARAAPSLVAALDRPGARLRRFAADALARLRAGAAPQLAVVLRQARVASADRRPEAIAALGGLLRGKPDPVARELLLGFAEGEDAGSALEAVDALAATRDGAAAPRLERLLGKSSTVGSLRRAVVSALGELGSAADVNQLLGRLEDDADPKVRAEAAWALGKRSDARAEAVESALTRALGSAFPSVRSNAAAALARLRRAPAALERLLSDRDPAARANAALALSTTAAARPALERLKSSDEDRRVRLAAARALGPPTSVAPRGDWTVWHVVDFDGAPLAEARYLLTLPDGLLKAGVSDARGNAREESVPTGTCDFVISDEPPVR